MIQTALIWAIQNCSVVLEPHECSDFLVAGIDVNQDSIPRVYSHGIDEEQGDQQENSQEVVNEFYLNEFSNQQEPPDT